MVHLLPRLRQFGAQAREARPRFSQFIGLRQLRRVQRGQRFALHVAQNALCAIPRPFGDEGGRRKQILDLPAPPLQR
ncbi:hypothetical protein AOQ71_13280 [Bradyrhizobium manausense]|uniref:Uncharacterized protein n=1 Tax=Bradyrhizobium manausense TaxID=989370 RepID=A0A0R3DWP7_9BRAD|nr:hypothetical protein AOQ71_13280 [Bradyrhizobium manausense]